jgi:uncharacterized protein YqkB
MKSRQLIPQETKGYFIDDKMIDKYNLPFQWKVDLIYIKSNSEFCSQRLK